MLVYIDGKTENHGELPKNRIFAGILSHCGAVCSSTLRTNNKPAAATGPLFTQFDSRNKIMNSLNTLMNCFLSRIFKILRRIFTLFLKIEQVSSFLLRFALLNFHLMILFRKWLTTLNSEFQTFFSLSNGMVPSGKNYTLNGTAIMAMLCQKKLSIQKTIGKKALH